MKYYFEHTGGDAHYTYGVAMREIENAPVEDVIPVVHGEWKVTALKISPRINSYGESALQRMWKIFTLQNCILPELLREDGRRNYKTHETCG